MPEHTTTLVHAKPPSTAETKVLAALAARPGSTVVEIARAAGIGRSTAGKILATAERHGRARRLQGERGQRVPDRWSPAPEASSARLGRGVLRQMVAEFLADHLGEEFTASAVAKALDRSAGAVANALATLTATGQAAQTSDQPARFVARTGNQPNAAADEAKQ